MEAVKLDWERIKANFDTSLSHYLELIGTPGVNTTLALKLTFYPLLKRYLEGERTQELYDEMSGVE